MYNLAKTMNPPRTVEEVVKDFKDRRAGIIKALTKDVEELYQLCDPNNPDLCLYGCPNQHWEVKIRSPSDLPEPRLGINSDRDTMTKHEWLSMVALQSDAWLYSIASYFATKFRFNKADKKRLFSKIADVPSISEVREGKANKRAKVEEGRGLPAHILGQEVLSRLPVRDLLRYRSVCKTWRSLIDGPNFVSDHLRNYRNNSEASHLLVFYSAPSRTQHEQVLVRRGDTFRKVQQLKNAYEFHNLVSYVNGVILVKKGCYKTFSEIILWNPSIDRSLNVPNSMFEVMRNATYFALGLGYDASCNDYKVVAIVYPHAEYRYSFGVRYRATVPGLVQVYALGNDSWSTNLGVSPPPYWTIGEQVYVNGAIHWINFGPNVTDDDSWYNNKDFYVVLFDVENEVFRYFELPSGMKSDDGPKKKFPTILGGLFAIFCDHEERHDIWVMTKYGVPDSWSKMYTFTLQFDELLHFKCDGELLFAVFGKGIKSYNVNRKRVKDLAKTYSIFSIYRVYAYVESLVLLKEGKKHSS